MFTNYSDFQFCSAQLTANLLCFYVPLVHLSTSHQELFPLCALLSPLDCVMMVVCEGAKWHSGIPEPRCLVVFWDWEGWAVCTVIAFIQDVLFHLLVGLHIGCHLLWKVSNCKIAFYLTEENMMWRARNFGDPKLYQRAQDKPTPSCDRLQQIYSW